MSLWIQKYRPTTIDEYVFSDKTTENKIKEWIANKDFPHLLFYGPAGTGKTTLVSLLLKYCEIEDYTRINASNKTGIDDTREVINFASIPPSDGSFKVIILEEMDRLSPQAQDSLKTVMEDYSGWCRFILTTNHINKITPPIKSRCQDVEIKKLNNEQFITRIISILQSENIIIPSIEILTPYIKAYYPDLRKCIGALQKNSVNNELQEMTEEGYTSEIFEKSLEFFDNHNLKQLRELIASNLTANDYDTYYRYLYDNIEKLTTNSSQYERCIIKIAEYIYKHSLVADMEINLIACLIEIEEILKG